LEEEFINLKYLNSYDYGVIRNTLFILSEEIKKMPDNELRKYFIYLKYLNVFIYPQIEIFFINNGCSIKSPININKNRYQVHEYTEEEYERCNRDNLIDNIINDIEYLLEGNDEDWKKYPYRLDFYRILALNKARLISVQDKSFINLIKMTTDYLIQDEEEYRVPEKEEIRLKINQMFIESLELLDTIENKRKLELK
ncbi:MAG: hypothetical protein K2I70_03340, partial [Bacilli bacterium]|nr:hypothetical protein [Bacilli bacterium]